MIFQVPHGVKQGIYYGLGLLMMKGVSLFMLPLFTAYLSIAEYGRLEVLTVFANLGTLILGFGLVDVLYRFAGGARSEIDRQRIAAELFGLSLIVGLISLVVLQVFSPVLAMILPADIHVMEIRWLVFAIALEGGIAIPLAWLRMRDKAKQFFMLTVTKLVLQAILCVWLLNAGWGIEGILIAGAVAALMMITVLSVLHYRDVGIVYSTANLRSLYTYGLPIVVSGIAAFGLNGFDRWLLAIELGEDALASFAVAAKFALVTLLFIQPFTLWWYPKRFILLNEVNGDNLNARYAVLGCVLAVLIACVVALISPWIIYWLTPQPYHEAIHYVPWLVLVALLKIFSELLNLGCYVENHSRLQMKIHLVTTAIGIVGFLLLIPTYGVNGVIISLLVASTLRLILFYILSQRLVYLPYRFVPLYGTLGVSIPLVLVGNMML